MKIRDILRQKGSDVYTISPEATAHEAMRMLARHNIGSLVVFDGEIRGIVTERDLLRVGADNLERLATAQVREIMTTAVITGTADADISDVMTTMTERRFRHLPVVEDGSLRGMVSIGDVVNALRTGAESENEYLHAYIHGTAG